MKKDENKKTAVRIRKPNGFIYYTVGALVYILSKILFRLKIDNKGIKGLKYPFLVIANHASMCDIAFTMCGLLPKRMNILTSKDLFSWKEFKPFINRIGCIPKSQFALDAAAIRMMKLAVEQGRSLVVYPEGKTSLDGTQLHYIHPSIAKLVKLLDVPVVMSKTLGAYLTKPRYFSGFRYGKVKMEQNVIISKEEVKSLSKSEIYDRICKAMAYNDHEYQRENHIKFRTKRPAEYLNYILYKCPRCGAEYEMRSTDKELICDACGNTVEYTNYGELIPKGDSVGFDTIADWYAYEKREVSKELEKGDFFISKAVDFFINDNNHYVKKGEGELYIDEEKIGFKGDKEGKPFEFSSPLKSLFTITTKNKEGIDLADCGVIYRFMFKEKKYSTKYGIIVEENYRIKQKTE